MGSDSQKCEETEGHYRGRSKNVRKSPGFWVLKMRICEIYNVLGRKGRKKRVFNGFLLIFAMLPVFKCPVFHHFFPFLNNKAGDFSPASFFLSEAWA